MGCSVTWKVNFKKTALPTGLRFSIRKLPNNNLVKTHYVPRTVLNLGIPGKPDMGPAVVLGVEDQKRQLSARAVGTASRRHRGQGHHSDGSLFLAPVPHERPIGPHAPPLHKVHGCA